MRTHILDGLAGLAETAHVLQSVGHAVQSQRLSLQVPCHLHRLQLLLGGRGEVGGR